MEHFQQFAGVPVFAGTQLSLIFRREVKRNIKNKIKNTHRQQQCKEALFRRVISIQMFQSFITADRFTSELGTILSCIIA